MLDMVTRTWMDSALGRCVRTWAVLIGSMTLCMHLGANSAQAQWGWGMGGWGMRGGGQISNAMTLRNINNRSSQAARAAYATRGRMPGAGQIYRGNPNAFVNQTRNSTFTDRFDASTRRSISDQAIRLPANADVAANPDPAASSRPRTILPFASFFSGAGKLVWPSEAPTTGALADQRQAADTALEQVYSEVRQSGHAPVGMVSDARTQLTDYGRPALAYLREHTTAAVVDTFHRFLLGLYDALGNAAIPQAPAAADRS